MMKIEDIKAGDSLDGVELASLVSVVAAAPISTGAVQLVYKTPDGSLKERLLSASLQGNGHVGHAAAEFPLEHAAIC